MGMIDIEKFDSRIQLLKAGKTLLLKHAGFGEYYVEMNPQQNRIFHQTVSGEELSEEKVNYLLMWDCGDWYLFEPPLLTRCQGCDGSGVTPINPSKVTRV